MNSAQALQIVFNAVSSASIYAMLAIGLTIFLGTLRILNFAQGDFATAGGYGIYVAVTATGVSVFVGLLAGAAIGALCCANPSDASANAQHPVTRTLPAKPAFIFISPCLRILPQTTRFYPCNETSTPPKLPHSTATPPDCHRGHLNPLP